MCRGVNFDVSFVSRGLQRQLWCVVCQSRIVLSTLMCRTQATPATLKLTDSHRQWGEAMEFWEKLASLSCHRHAVPELALVFAKDELCADAQRDLAQPQAAVAERWFWAHF